MTDMTAQDTNVDTLKKTFIALKRAQARVASLEARHAEPIAIVGIACRLPGGANDPDALWSLLCRGNDTAGPIPADRWDESQFYSAAPDTPGRTHAAQANFLDIAVDAFDAPFFGVSAKEALSMDPQQRLLLELGWEALEDAGFDPTSLRGSATGVFVGISSDDYAQAHRHSGRLELIDGYSLTGTCMAPAAGRISYTFGFEGPSLAVDTACSSSLVAVHLACQSLREGESDVALAAGINLMLSPVFHIASSKLGTISPDGLCKTFDESADGYGRGEGGGMVVLKRLANAQADGDRILAAIRGSAVNQDGKSNGLTAPNGLAQERVIREALDRAGLMPADIDYIEVHGTGTSLGDPIEVEAIGRVMLDRPVDRPVVLGTVKSNIGHLEAAAGIAGLIRAVQCLRHEEIPAHLHLDRPSPHIPWGRYPFKVVTERTVWSRGDRPRRAGVSSFGFSGTNAHVILEEAPLLEDKAGAFPEMGEGEALILPLSARTEEGLVALATRWREWLSVPTAPIPAGVATAAAGRHHMAQRVAIVGRDAEELIAGLTAFVEGKPDRAVATGSGGTRPRIAGLFTGQGSQYAGMGRGLYAGEPVFRATIDACDAAVGDRLGRRLVDLLYGDSASDAELQQTGFAQPALFAVELALYRLLESWGVVPQVVCGHSIGEFAAAHVAGILSFDAAIEMVCARGRLMQALPDGGAMAAVFASEEKIAQFLTSSTDISLAAVNTPDDVVVSGPAEAVRKLLAELEQRGIRAQPLRVSHAFHSTLMQPMVADFAGVAARPFGSASMPIVSTVTGRRAGPDEMACADYWTGQIGATVRFAAAAAALAEDGVSQFLEYGPAPVLAGLAQQSIDPEGRQFLGTLVRGADDDRRSTLQSLARLYASGVDIDWKAVYHRHRTRVAVPTYPFQRTRYYRAPIVDAGRHAPIVSAGHAHAYLGQRIHSRLLPSGAALYQALFTAEAPSFLVEHQIFGVIISPAAAHLSMAFAAAGHGRGLEDVSFTAPLVIEAAAPRLVQLGMTGDPAPVYTVASQAVDAPGEVWTVHSEGRMTAMPGSPDRVDLDAIRRRCTVPMAPAEFYALIETLGYKTGENFQCIREIAKGDGEALCRIVAPQPIDGKAIHPGLIDSMLQTVLPACERSAGHLLDGDSVLIPLHMARVALYGSLDQPLFCHSRVEVGGEVVKAEILACTAQGEAVLAIEGFLLKRTDRATLYQEMRDDDRERVQRIAWQPITITADAELQGSGWIVLSGGDAGNAWGGALAAHIVASGGECLVLEPGADLARAVEAWLARRALARVTVLFAAEESGGDPVAETRATLAAVLPVVQALNRGAIPVEARLWLLSRQAQAVVPEDAGATRPTLAGAALWGFGRAIASEMPELWGGLIDVDPRPNAAGIAALAALVAHPGGEDQLAIRRGGQVLAARLVPSTDRRQDALPELADGQKYRLDRGPLRTLDDLRFARLARAVPGKDEVEIEVLAAGLNFRDVLNALGQYPGEAGLLGFEAVGRIVALGNAAGGLALGDTVIALAAPGCIGSHVTVNRALVVRKPADMSAVTAVALPAALLTAYYALHHLGGMQRGDRVLIHAAAGGVGMAAVQLALAAGAEVFATVGSPEKRAVLEAMGVTHILSSRTLDFVEQIRRATDGRGVTMVLNSLSGSFIAASFDVLAPGGRFLEMGKIGIWDEAQAQARDPHALYRPFDLAAVALEDPASLVAMFEQLLVEVAQGRLEPLPVTVFPMAEAEDAFRFMAQARHIGKIVLSREDEARRTRLARDGVVRADAQYLITGGLGALGLYVARWLVESGARHLVLTGRRGPTDMARAAIEALEAEGAKVTIVAGDVAVAADVARMVAAAVHLPLAGVFHAAGLLEDGMIADLELAQLDRILAPKVTGGWLLHQATRHLDLDLFVCFSSVAAMIGNLGQGGYAAANAGLDGLALYRRRRGLAAVSVNWGPWAEAGMAATLETDRFILQGIRQIAPTQALRTMARLLADPPVQAVVADIDWGAYGRAHGLDDRAGLFAALVGAKETATLHAAEDAVARDIIAEVQAALAGEREEMMRRYLQDLARQTLGYAHGEPIAADKPLADQGFDSLMSVDMRNRLNRGLGRTLPASLLFDYPTLDRIGRHLLETMLPVATAPPPSAPAASAEDILDEIESLIGATPTYEPAAE